MLEINFPINFQLVLLSVAAVLLTQTAAAPPSYGKSYGAVPGIQYTAFLFSQTLYDF
jgi:hypothetical protein